VTINLNLAAPFFLSKHMVPAMKEKGWGRIVNFASLQSHRAFPGGLSYGASKGGIGATDPRHGRGLVARRDHANAIGPGFFRTELTAAVFADPSAPRATPRRPASAAMASPRISTARSCSCARRLRIRHRPDSDAGRGFTAK
jgi:NAD(P)-dependent dehydrogenase (short-subunit alcohol dehydrogenase family)